VDGERKKDRQLRSILRKRRNGEEGSRRVPGDWTDRLDHFTRSDGEECRHGGDLAKIQGSANCQPLDPASSSASYSYPIERDALLGRNLFHLVDVDPEEDDMRVLARLLSEDGGDRLFMRYGSHVSRVPRMI
jgi:hypothetical protein